MSDDPNTQVGRLVAELRGRTGWSQSFLADKLSAELGKRVEPLTVTRLEGGKRPIPVNELLALARIFEVSPADLLPWGTPLRSQLIRWRSLRKSHERELAAAVDHVDLLRDQLSAFTEPVSHLRALLDYQQARQLNGEVIRAIRALPQIVHQSHDDVVDLLADAGIDDAIVGAAIDKLNDWVEGNPNQDEARQTAFMLDRIASSLELRLTMGNGNGAEA